MRRQDRAPNPRHTLLAALACVVTLSLSASLAPAAVAARSDRSLPTEEEVAAAEARVAARTRDVGAIQASLLLANRRLEQAAVEAEVAAEAYHGAMWRLSLAQEEVDRAQAEADAARQTVRRQRDVIGRLVATSYQRGAELTALSAMMGSDGPEGVLDQYVAFQGASGSMQADFDRFAAADALARVFEEKAEEARAEHKRLAAQARSAKDLAQQAADAAQATATEITAEKDRLIRELARAQDVSVQLALERQTALEERARQRAAERARRDAEAAARAEARREAAEARAQEAMRRKAEQAEQAARHARARRAEAADHRAKKDRPAPAPALTPAPAPPPTPPAPPSGSGGADRAIAYATAQVGEPYVWGAAGPDAWDCSGLMLGAWGTAGVYLPHYSAAQYYAGTPISAGDLRPGDLVFWGTSSDPDSIHHVAMYIGGGQIVHAPRTGRPVSIDSLYYWLPPNFFARV